MKLRETRFSPLKVVKLVSRTNETFGDIFVKRVSRAVKRVSQNTETSFAVGVKLVS